MLTLYYMMKLSKNKTINNVDLDSYYKNSSKLKTKHNLISKCRVCLKEGTVYLHENADLIETLQILTDIQITQEDENPQKLCDVCYNLLKKVLIFRKTAKSTEEALKQPITEEKFNIPLIDYHDLNDETLESTQKWSDDDFKEEKKVRPKSVVRVTCHICNKVVNRSYYKEHMTMHDPDHQNYVCDVCGKSFRLRCAYANHRLRHRSDFPFKCQFCPYRGRYSELLKTHLRTHTGDYRYMCTECPARFLFKSNLNTHMFKHKEPQFKCDTCKRGFHSKLLLQRHYEADHLGIKNHVCNVCGKAFGYRNALMKHQRHVHKREKSIYGRMPSYLVAEHKERL